MIALLDIGDGVETGSYRLHSRFRDALAFMRNGTADLVSVVDESKSPGPAHIVVRGLDVGRTRSLEVTADRVWLDGAALAIHRRSDWRVPRLNYDCARLARNLAALRGELIASGPARSIVFLLREGGDALGSSAFERALASRFRSGVAALVAGDLTGAAAIRGLGFGLTPSGDDFLAGFLLGLYALERAGVPSYADKRREIFDIARSDNPFSAALLRNACQGRSIEPVRSLIGAVFEEAEAGVLRQARRLCAVGASSGADTAVGLYFALRQGEEL